MANQTALSAGQQALLETALKLRQQQLGRRLAEQHGGLSQAEYASEVLRQGSANVPQREDQRELEQVLSEIETRELAAIGLALTRMQSGAYGVCADCADPIPFDRLKAEPWALRCVPCETKKEDARRSRTG